MILSFLSCSSVYCPRGGDALTKFVTQVNEIRRILEEVEQDLVRLGTEVVTSVCPERHFDRPFSYCNPL